MTHSNFPRCYISEIKILIFWFLLPNSLACKIISTTTNFLKIVWKFAYFCFLITWCYWNDVMINRIVFLKTSSYHKIKCYKSKRNWLQMCFLISTLKLIDFEQVIIFSWIHFLWSNQEYKICLTRLSRGLIEK